MRVQEQPVGIADLAIVRWIRVAAQQLNALSDGRIAAFDTAQTAAPTTGTWKQGDVVKNSQPTEAGTAGNKYIVTSWTCTASGSPGTWLPNRTLTGN